ncbi:MAG: outer membrane protein assembly factor BamD [Vicinamibacteria bacterium]
MRTALPLLAAALLLASCGGTRPDIATLASNSDQVIWEAGQKAAEKKQWETARQHFKRIVEGFPQSQIGPQARLALADSYFQEGGTGNYILAVSAYREFLTFFPTHARSDYAQFQVGESFWRQKNGPDRDQTATEEALGEFQKVLELYPESAKTEETRERIKACRQSLAHAEFLTGKFYQRTRQACRASITRYEGLLNEYPEYTGLDEVLYRLSECLCQAGRGAEAQPHLAKLQEEYPTSPFTVEARSFTCATPVAPPPAAPAAAPTAEASPVPSPTPTPSAPPTP